MRARMLTAAGAVLGALSIAPLAGQAQGPDGRWPLQPRTATGRLVAPFLEGWYANEDGTLSYSFGYRNMNDQRVDLPLGALNVVSPARIDGLQPTVFEPGRQRGVFAVTVPAEMRDSDVWWTLTNADGEVTRVPGRNNWGAYQLDWIPRPHGSVHPRVSFDGGPEGRGPVGVVAERSLTTSVGAPLTIAIDVHDPSERDAADHRLREAIPVRVVWFQHQAPVGAVVEFTRHESTPLLEGRRGGADDDADEGATADGAVIELPSGRGTALVVATFSAVGDYVLRARADNWSAPDSSSGNQCCWTNGYVRVSVR